MYVPDGSTVLVQVVELYNTFLSTRLDCSLGALELAVPGLQPLTKKKVMAYGSGCCPYDVDHVSQMLVSVFHADDLHAQCNISKVLRSCMKTMTVLITQVVLCCFDVVYDMAVSYLASWQYSGRVVQQAP